MNDAKLDFQENGFTQFKNIIPVERFVEFEKTICDLIISSVNRLPKDLRLKFEANKYSKKQLPHEGLIKLFELSHKYEQIVVDALTVSKTSYELLFDKNLTTSILDLLNIKDANHLSVNEVFVRVDLPSKYSEISKTIELPSHQESSYFKESIDFHNGVVVWIPIFDCAPINGSLIVYPKSHKLGLVEHKARYLLPKEKKFYRTTVSDKILKSYSKKQVQTKRGDCIIQHFNLIHQSALNLTSDKVRYTILMRTCDITSKQFNPVSWNKKI